MYCLGGHNSDAGMTKSSGIVNALKVLVQTQDHTNHIQKMRWKFVKKWALLVTLTVFFPQIKDGYSPFGDIAKHNP